MATALAVVAVLGAGPAGGQEGTGQGEGAGTATSATVVPVDPPGTPFPAQLVATVPPSAGEVPDALALTGFYTTPGLEPDRPTVVLRFAGPFALPEDPWRASVAVGDPLGEHLRVSLEARGGATSGVVEVGEDGAYAAIASAEAAFQPSGLVTLEVPLDEVPEGATTWAEVALDGADGDEAVVRSPWYPQAALLGTGAAGIVPSSTYGRVAVDGAAAGGDGALPPAVDLGPGPSVGLAPRPDDPGSRSVVLVTWDAPAPVAVDGVPVAEVVDLVRVAPDDVGDAVTTPYVSVERSTGAVALVEGRAWPLEDRSGDRAWYLAANSTFGDQGLEVLALDLDAVLAALGDDVGRDSVALGVTRTLRLEDGRQVVAEGVLGTTAWLDQAVDLTVPTTTAPPPPITASSQLDTTTGRLTFLGWLALALIAVGWMAALLAVRHRRRGRAPPGRRRRGGGGRRGGARGRPAVVGAHARADAAGGRAGPGGWRRGRRRRGRGGRSCDRGRGGDGGRRRRRRGGRPDGRRGAGGRGAGRRRGDRGGPRRPAARGRSRPGGRATSRPAAEAPATPAAPPRHRPSGVTIDAALATELAGDGGSGPEPGPAPDGVPDAEGPGPPDDAHPADADPDEALSTLSHDLSELTERLRRLEGDDPSA